MSDEAKQISRQVLISLVKKQTATKTKVAEMNGELGERVKAAVENGGLHKKAFSLLCQLHGMEELKRQEFRDALSLYLDIADEHLWSSGHTGDLLKDAPAEEEDTDEKAAAANAKALRKGIKQKVEEDDEDEDPPSAPDPLEDAFGLPPLGDKAGSYSVN